MMCANSIDHIGELVINHHQELPILSYSILINFKKNIFILFGSIVDGNY